MNLIGSKFAFRQSSQFIRKLILYLLTFVSIATYGQGAEERVLYVIDSVAIIDDPGEDEGTISNRAFARLRKYEFKNSRTLSKSSGVTVLASKDKVEIPKDELDKICADLKRGIELGDNKPMTLDAQKTYCQ